MRTLACAACLLGAILCGWLLERVVGRPRQPVVDSTVDRPELLLALPPVVVWLECPSTACAHLETPHQPVGPEAMACSWCGRIRTTKGADRG